MTARASYPADLLGADADQPAKPALLSMIRRAIRSDSRLICVLVLTAVLSLIAGCSDPAAQTAAETEEQAGQVSTDIEQLGKLIRLPYVPVSASWQAVDQVPERSNDPLPIGGNDWSLVALLQFAPADYDELQRRLVPLSWSESLYLPEAALAWMPEDIRRASEGLERPAAQDAHYLQHDASLFSKSPLLHGFASPVGQGRVLVVLDTM